MLSIPSSQASQSSPSGTHSGSSSLLSSHTNRTRLSRAIQSDGTSPVSSLSARCRSLRVGPMSPSSAGTSPTRPLSLRSRYSSDSRLPSCGGIEPVKRLWLSTSRESDSRSPSSGGIEPVSPRLRERSRYSSDSRSPSSGGIEPVSPVLLRYSSTSDSSLPRSGGMEPLNRLVDRSKSSRLERSPSSRGSTPTKLLLLRPTSLTVFPAVAVTPNQSFSGRSDFQFVPSVQFGPAVLSYSASRAPRSPAVDVQDGRPSVSWSSSSSHVMNAGSLRGTHTSLPRMRNCRRSSSLASSTGMEPLN